MTRHRSTGVLEGQAGLPHRPHRVQGSLALPLAARLGAEVTGYALTRPTDPSLFELARVGSVDASRVIADVRDAATLAAALAEARPEVVFHLAAQPLVRDSYRIPVETYAINVMGTVNLLEAVRALPGVRAVVNVTTDKCYENREWVWGYRENEPLGGHDPYSSSKACSELVTAAYRSSFFTAGATRHRASASPSARAGNVIGGGDWAADRLLPDCVRAILEGKKILDPQSRRHPSLAARPGAAVRLPRSWRESCTRTGSRSPPPGTSARKTRMRDRWSGWSGGSAEVGQGRRLTGSTGGSTRTRRTT